MITDAKLRSFPKAVLYESPTNLPFSLNRAKGHFFVSYSAL